MLTRLACLLGLLSILDARDCGYVQTDTSPSGFAALDTCGEYSFSQTIPNELPQMGTTTKTFQTSFRYECNSDGSAVILYFWEGLGNCSTIAEASDSEEITDDTDDFNCGKDNCGAVVTLQESDGDDCDSLTDSYFTYPYLTGYCVYYTNDDDYSEFYTCTEDSLIYEQYNSTTTCGGEPVSETELYNSCASVTVTIGEYEASGSYLSTVDDCNNAYNNGINFIIYSLGIMISTVWAILK